MMKNRIKHDARISTWVVKRVGASASQADANGDVYIMNSEEVNRERKYITFLFT
ncbi:hypothetical protein FRB94_004476 [Tulasnella sp. JGI-2019a]|nr:hypothetical protein FRB94_004476 [Tulasnella sp. JGI-2019a]